MDSLDIANLPRTLAAMIEDQHKRALDEVEKGLEEPRKACFFLQKVKRFFLGQKTEGATTTRTSFLESGPPVLVINGVLVM